MAFTIKGGKFSTTDDDRTIRQPSPVDEVIDILDERIKTNPQALENIRNIYNQSVQPQRPAPVNVGMMPERRGDVTIPMQQSAYKPFGNIIARDRTMGQTTDLNYQMDPKDNLGFVQSPYATFNPNAANFSDFMSGDVNQPKPGISSLQNISSGYPMKPDPGYEAALQKATPSGLGGIFQGILGSLTGSNPAVYMQTDEYGDPMGGGNYAVGRTFENADTARRLGFIPVGRDAAGNIVYDVDPAVKASQERQERDSRLDDERRERAAMLAAQQQQPVDPCPEGYRLDPVSKVCVPVDDTTEPKDPATRTYDTMTRPEPNYTPATNFNIPAITLPDILTGN